MVFRLRTIYSLTTFVLALSILILTSLPKKSAASLIACDVGQGDAILIIKDNIQVLIDGGPSGDKVLSCLGNHLPFWDRTIELVVFTNTDYDHLNGLSSVLSHYHIGKIVTGDGVGESDAITQFVDVLGMINGRIEQVGAGDILKIGDLTFHVLWPKNPNPNTLLALNPKMKQDERTRVLGINLVKNTNERSVVLLFNEQDYRVLLVGDIGESTEQKLLADKVLSKVDLLKVGHHGSKYSSCTAFLQQIRPSQAIISVGKNLYGHPTQETLARLDSVGAKVLRTDREGDIVVDLIK